MLQSVVLIAVNIEADKFKHLSEVLSVVEDNIGEVLGVEVKAQG